MIGLESGALFQPPGLSTLARPAVSNAERTALAPSTVNPTRESGKPLTDAGSPEAVNPYGVREFPFLTDGFSPEELATRGKVLGAERADSPREVMEAEECQTCKNRKYQDGSDDPGVSFKNATRVDPRMAESAVRGHEQEHVVREQAKAKREDRKVVSQSVTYHTAICPECGRIYVSGGTTRTVTAPDTDKAQKEQTEEKGAEPALEIDTEHF